MIKITVYFSEEFTIKARIEQDGDQWVCLAGKDLMSGVAGFGFTVTEAIAEFKSNIRNDKPIKYNKVKKPS